MTLLKGLKRFFFPIAASLAILILIFVFWARDRYVVPILMYHHVSSALGRTMLNNVNPEAFARQLKYIKEHGYNVVSFDDYVSGARKGYAFGRNTVVIQFDDGYDDNYSNAFPILKQHGFPASVFLIADKIGTAGFLTWEQVREMDASGFTAGSHTRTHVHLPDVALAVAREEIFGSKRVIEQHLGHAVDYFVYPSGGFTADTERLVQEAGYKAAATTNRGADRFNRNLYELNRIRAKSSDSSVVLWAKLSGYYNLFRRSHGSKWKNLD